MDQLVVDLVDVLRSIKSSRFMDVASCSFVSSVKDRLPIGVAHPMSVRSGVSLHLGGRRRNQTAKSMHLLVCRWFGR